MSTFSPRVLLRFAVAVGLIGLTLVANKPQKTVAAPTSNPNKITICHRTHATTNPYRRITVNVSSIFNGNPSSSLDDPQANGNGHGRFQHNDWIESEAWLASNGTDATKARPVPNVYNPNTTYPSNKKRWGDIIPDVKVNGSPANRTAAPLNFDPGNTSDAGYAIYNNLPYNGDARYASMCKRMSGKQLCEAEVPAFVASGMTQADAERKCMEELAEQDALDDAPLKTACGNDISTCSVTKLSVYGTTTGTASCSNGVATFNGSTNLSTLSGEATFAVGTTTAFGTSLNASPLAVTGAASFTTTYNIPGDGTYYFKAMVTTTDGNESVIEGGTVTLVVSGGACSVSGAEAALPANDPSASTSSTSSTSTTIASSTSTTVTSSSAVGALEGIFWVDADQDDSKDSSELWIPGIVITLTGPNGGTTTSSSAGAYKFSNLTPGTYTVTATLPGGLGLNKSWDSQGSTDWVVTVTVVAGKTARADFAAVGKVDVVGKLSNTPPGSEVELEWSGLDKELDTNDDSSYITKLNSDQTFTVQNVPTGKYRVRAQSVRVNLVIGATGATYKNGPVSVVAAVATLPETGTSSTLRLMPAVMALIPLGLFATLWSRRRRRLY